MEKYRLPQSIKKNVDLSQFKNRRIPYKKGLHLSINILKMMFVNNKTHTKFPLMAILSSTYQIHPNQKLPYFLLKAKNVKFQKNKTHQDITCQ